MMNAVINFQEGTIYKGYQVKRRVELKELQAVLIELVHLQSGAEIVHIANEDVENFFCLSFRTYPENSNGVAHILEHTVLCGSKKYPIKDPFFSMLSRSLHTFMNAMTGPDWTCYPAASQVEKDFYNILDVYIDAVFHPILDEKSFRQEGIRLEFAEIADASTPLEYKGIVYNEMKGVMSSVNERLAQDVSEALFPDVSYGRNFGGDPKNIPELTYDEFKKFHEDFYHPSRCTFFFYGNLPLEKHLDVLANNILDGVEKLADLPPFPDQKRFTEKKYLTRSYPSTSQEEGEDKAYINFAWLTANIREQEDVLAICLIDSILMDTDASPLKKALLQSGMCGQAYASVDIELNEVPVVLTLKGCEQNDADKLEKLIFDTIEKIADEGITMEQVEPILHQLEFHRSEIHGNSHPFGLILFMRSIPLKQHGVLPEEGLKVHAIINALRSKVMGDPQYLSKLMRKYFIDNKHYVRLVMVPDHELLAQESAQERMQLDAIKAGLDAAAIEELIMQAKELAQFQEEQENQDIDILPKVTLQDVDADPWMYSLHHSNCGKVKVYHHACFTNEILYADLIYDLPNITVEEQPYAILLCSLLTQLGNGGKSYTDVLDYMQAYIGSISASLGTFNKANASQSVTPYFAIKGKVLYRNVEKLFALFVDVLNSVDFDDKTRLNEIIQKYAVSMRTSITSEALRYATNLANSWIDASAGLAYYWGGLPFYHFFIDLADNFESRYENLVATLKALYKKMIGNDNPQLIVSCDASMFNQLSQNFFYGIEEIPSRPLQQWTQQINVPQPISQGRIISAPVAFVAKAFPTVSYTNPLAPNLHIAANLFDNVTLHRKIREIGGAYGGGASNKSLNGRFNFYSYRDPNIYNTLMAFDMSVSDIVKGDFDNIDLDEAKLEVIQGLDMPVPPGARARMAYEWLRYGLDFDTRKQYRTRILEATEQDIIHSVSEVIVPALKNAPVVVFAGKELLEKENGQLTANGRALEIMKI